MEISGIGQNSLTAAAGEAKVKAHDDAFQQKLESAMENKDEAQLKELCKEFETVIVNMLYSQMKATIPKSDLIPQDAGRDIYQSMLDEKIAEEASKDGGIGLGDVLYKQLSRRLKSAYEPE